MQHCQKVVDGGVTRQTEEGISQISQPEEITGYKAMLLSK